MAEHSEQETDRSRPGVSAWWTRALILIAATVAFLALLAAGVWLTAEPTQIGETEQTYVRYVVSAELIIAALVPLLAGLVLSNRIASVKGGNVEIVFQQKAENTITVNAQDLVRAQPETIVVERTLTDGGYDVERSGSNETATEKEAKERERATVLSLQLGRYYDDSADGYYRDDLLEYIREFDSLQHVVFRDLDDDFKGLVAIGDFWTLLNSEEYDVAEEINTGSIARNCNLVVRDGVDFNITNARALDEFDRKGREILPVTRDSEYVGTLSRSQVVSRLLPLERPDEDSSPKPTRQ